MLNVANIIENNGGFIKTNEIDNQYQYRKITNAAKDGSLIRIRQGLYADPLALANTMIDVEKFIPNGILCLYSAFIHYDLSTQIPSAYCIAIDNKRKVRLPEYPLIDLYYWKKENLEVGVITKEISGYQVQITDLERTVCDAVKYRNKIGLDVCGEVIKDYLSRNDYNIGKLHEYAKILRINNIITKYIETRI